MIAANLVLPKISYLAISPEIALSAGALILLMINSLTSNKIKNSVYVVIATVAGLISVGLEVALWHSIILHGSYKTLDGSLSVDGFSTLLGMVAATVFVLFALSCETFLERERWGGPEIFALAALSSVGAQLMAGADDLILVFLGLEILSIALYVMSAMDLRRVRSGEAAMKYLILGGMSSAIFVYGIALTYGATGSTNFTSIATFFKNNALANNGLLLVGIILVLVGFSFKVSLAPFHVWTPDVYEGSPSPATMFMAAAAKVGGFAALLRAFSAGFGLYREDWQPILWVLAALSMLVGSFGGLSQVNVKRMLAYSAINHSGFILLGLVSATTVGIEASVSYLIAYSFFTMGAFSIVAIVGAKGDGSHGINRFRGLSKSHPYLAGALALFLIAQAGIPFTSGFVAKVGVLEALAATGGAGSYTLVTIALVTSVVSAFYYFRVVIAAYSPPKAILAKEDAKHRDGEPEHNKLEHDEVGYGEAIESSQDYASELYELKELVTSNQTTGLKEKTAVFDDIRLKVSTKISLSIMALFTVGLGVVPNLLLDLARHANIS